MGLLTHLIGAGSLFWRTHTGHWLLTKIPGYVTLEFIDCLAPKWNIIAPHWFCCWPISPHCIDLAMLSEVSIITSSHGFLLCFEICLRCRWLICDETVICSNMRYDYLLDLCAHLSVRQSGISTPLTLNKNPFMDFYPSVQILSSVKI